MNIVQGSILDFEGDAIVNPANSFLRHGGGLARVIAEAAAPWRAGSAYWDDWDETERQEALTSVEWRREQVDHPNIPTGGCDITSAGALPYKAILHAVGPIWGGGGYFERSLLNLAHAHACELALRHGFRSIAFPAISCGIFGFPVDEAAPIAVRVARSYYREDLDITFYLFEDEHYAAFTRAAQAT